MSDPTWIPAIVIATPILAAAVVLLGGRIRTSIAWWIALLTIVFEAGLVLLLGRSVLRGGPVHHNLGGFNPPIGIELVADELSTLVATLIAGFALLTLLYLRGRGPPEVGVMSLFLLHVGGLLGMALTADLFNLFVFLEVTGITTYALVASSDRPPAALAAVKYLVIGTVGATFYLVGVGLLFSATGTLNMADMAASLAGGGSAARGVLYGDRLVLAAFVFIFMGLATKIALFPLHSWQPDAYAEAPDGVTMLISALVSTTATYALIRITFDVFTVAFFDATPVATWVIVSFGLVSIVVGSGLAAIQSRVKRMFAYSSMAQFGLIVTAVGLATGPTRSTFVLTGAIVHLLGHGLMKGGAFAVIGYLAQSTGARTLPAYADLGRSRPFAAASLGVLGFALVGVPPSIGFLGKWYIAVGAVESGQWLVAGLVFLTTILTLGYIARVLERLYFVPASDHAAEALADGGRASPNRIMLVVIGAIAVATVALGFAGGVLFDLVQPFVEGALQP